MVRSIVRSTVRSIVRSIELDVDSPNPAHLFHFHVFYCDPLAFFFFARALRPQLRLGRALWITVSAAEVRATRCNLTCMGCCFVVFSQAQEIYRRCSVKFHTRHVI